MKPASEKILKSGIIDRGFAQLLEKWGNLPEGASELTKSNELHNATKEHLTKFAEELAEAVANEHVLRETSLDLEHLKFPVVVAVCSKIEVGVGPDWGVNEIPGMEDRMGRLYFRFQDVAKEWFVPGFFIRKSVFDKETQKRYTVNLEILEVTTLFVGDQEIALQVLLSRLTP